MIAEMTPMDFILSPLYLFICLHLQIYCLRPLCPIPGIFPERPAIDQFTDHLNVNKSIDQQVLLAVYYPQLPLLLPVDPSHSLISFDHHPQVLPSTAGQVNRESFTTTSLSTTLSVQYPRVSQVSLVCSSYKRRDKISQSHSLSSVASKAQAVLLIK